MQYSFINYGHHAMSAEESQVWKSPKERKHHLDNSHFVLITHEVISPKSFTHSFVIPMSIYYAVCTNQKIGVWKITYGSCPHKIRVLGDNHISSISERQGLEKWTLKFMENNQYPLH